MTQKQNFRDGTHGSHRADPHGTQMRAAALLASDDQEVADIVRYITSTDNN